MTNTLAYSCRVVSDGEKKVLIGGHLIAEGDPDVVVLGLKAGHPVGVQHVLTKFLENIFSKII
jgi:hypothetical protein